MFACQHLTRDLVWRPEWEGHANGAERVSGVIVVHPSPADLEATYARLFGAAVPARSRRPGRHARRRYDQLPHAGGFRGSAFRRFPIPADLSKGWFAGATLRVLALDKVAAILAAAGVAAARTPSGSLVVAPAEAADTLLEFKAA